MGKELSRPSFPKPDFFPKNRTQLSYWTLSEKLTGDGPRHRPFHRICDLAHELGCRTITVQRIDNSDAFDEFFPEVSVYCKEATQVAQIKSVDQVCFLTEARKKVVHSFPDRISEKNLIGMAIVIKMRFTKPTPRHRRGDVISFVYEAVIRPLNGSNTLAGDIGAPARTDANYYSHLCRPYRFHIAKKEVTLVGSLFHGSEELEAACIQSSLCTGFRHFSRNLSYVEMNAHVQGVRKMLTPQAGDFDPAEGYKIRETAHLISKKADLAYRILDCRNNPDVDPFDWAYLAAESGMATYLMFPPSSVEGEDRIVGHVLPVIGHTTSYHEWRPIAHSFYEGTTGLHLYQKGKSYVSTVHWAPQLLVHDSIVGPSYCLGERDLLEVKRKPDDGCTGDPSLCDVRTEITSRIRYVVAILPKGIVSMDPYVAQDIAASILNSKWESLRRLAPHPWNLRFQRDNGPLNSHKTRVFRTQLVHKADYICHIKDARDYYGNPSNLSAKDENLLLARLPDRFWMAEFTCPQVYSVVRAKCGEILLKCDVSKAVQRAFWRSEWPEILLGIRLFGKLKLGKTRRCSLGFRSHTGLFVRSRSAILC